MPRHVLLNNNNHKNLKVRESFGAEFGEDVMCLPVYPVEVRHAQAHYPLMFAKNENGKIQLVALLGFENGENLYLDGNKWLAAYRPLVVEKGPFLIGRNPEDESILSIHIDLDDKRVNEQEGQSIFLPHGGNTDYLDNIANILSTLNQSLDVHDEFVKRCEEHSLIESFVLDVDLESGGTHRMSGFFTINEETLNNLNAEQLAFLHAKGDLEIIYMMLASLSQLSSLIRKKKAV